VTRTFARLLAPFAVLVLLGAACSGDSSDPTDDGSGNTVEVTLADDSVTLSSAETSAGSVTFAATNDGTLTHEIEVFEGDADPASLPIENDVANTEGWTLVDEIEDITPGSSADLTLDLEAGSYQIVCNLAGHFSKGMYSTLTVV
jgi:iron uptake system component EfeO